MGLHEHFGQLETRLRRALDYDDSSAPSSGQAVLWVPDGGGSGKFAPRTITPSGIGAATASHTHGAGDVTSGTLAVARLPVGTAAGTVAAGNDSRITGAEQAANRNQPNGYAPLDSTGLVPYEDLPTFLGADRIGVTRYAEVPSDQTVNNSTTLVNATGLAFSVTSGGVYLLDGHFRYSANATPDIKFALAGITASLVQWSLHGLDTGVTSGAGSMLSNVALAIGTALVAGGTNGSAGIVRPKGIIKPSSTGTLLMQWAQSTANSSNTQLNAGSFLTLTRVG